MISKLNDVPVLNGLILSGGMSVRMGSPKDRIHWHGKEQRYFLADLLAVFCKKVYISCRQDQVGNIDPNYQTINDVFPNIGPAGGLLSAFRKKPNDAWLVVACDMPMLDGDSIQLLIQSRDSTKCATAYVNPNDNLPEPLITIWEPKSYPILNDSFTLGHTSLRKFLINNDIVMIKPLKPEILFNVNTPMEMLNATKILKIR